MTNMPTSAQQTSVWEVDGARHREILSSPSFLRELRMELRHIFNGKTSADKVCGNFSLSEIWKQS